MRGRSREPHAPAADACCCAPPQPRWCSFALDGLQAGRHRVRVCVAGAPHARATTCSWCWLPNMPTRSSGPPTPALSPYLVDVPHKAQAGAEAHRPQHQEEACGRGEGGEGRGVRPGRAAAGHGQVRGAAARRPPHRSRPSACSQSRRRPASGLQQGAGGGGGVATSHALPDTGRLGGGRCKRWSPSRHAGAAVATAAVAGHPPFMSDRAYQ